MPRKRTSNVGAYKLLALLLYTGKAPVHYDYSGFIIPSVWKLAQFMGVRCNTLRDWLDYLERMGYITSMAWNEPRTSFRGRLREPTNI